jgi:alcohol dehydrogenase
MSTIKDPVSTAAWRLAAPGGALSLEEITVPEPRPGTVRVRMAAVPLLSYLRTYAEGKLPYWYPAGPFTPGTNGIGTVEAVGADVYHLSPGQRVAVSPHLVANEIADEPAQVLIGLSGISPNSGPMLAAWGDGTLAERVIMPASVLAPLDGLDHLPAERLAAVGKFMVPLGGYSEAGSRQGRCWWLMAPLVILARRPCCSASLWAPSA